MNPANTVFTPKTAWEASADRISSLATAIMTYAENEHGELRRILIRHWAEEILMQCDIWDRCTEKWSIMEKE